MRVLVCLAVMVMLVPLTGAQTDLLDDPEGDVTAYAQGTATPAQSPESDAVDLRALRVLEHEDTFDFTIEVQGFDQPEANLNLEIRFQHGAEAYLIDMYGILGGTTAELTGNLLRTTGQGFERIAEVPVSVDATTATVEVPRYHLMDERGATPRIGHQLTDIRVLARGSETLYVMGDSGAVGWRDNMPDSGDGAVYASIVGLEQSGKARLTSDEPMRYSNGEATTFVYTIRAHNDGDAEQLFTFAATDLPDGWDIYFPARSVLLEAGRSTQAAVVVQVPFQHTHGEETTFIVEMTGQRDPGDVGRIELGVRYPDTPQPSGHHPRLWLHSQIGDPDPFAVVAYALYESIAGGGQKDLVYMNTLDEDPLSDGIDVQGGWCDTLWAEPPDPSPVGGESIPEAAVYCWAIPLSPTLRMGLDFDLQDMGRIEVPIHSTAPADRAWVGGQVIYLPPDAPPPGTSFGDSNPPQAAIVLAELRADENVTFGADSQHVLTATIEPTDAGDVVPYMRGGNLWLWLNVTQERPETVAGPKSDKPAIVPGGFLELPLIDYADPVDDIFGTGRTLDLHTTEAQRYVNPGETVVFEVGVENQGDTASTVDLLLVGGQVDWARIDGARSIRIDAGGAATVLVAVTAPADARDGERADLILEVARGDEPEARALLRLVAEVDEDADHEDQAALVGGASAGGRQSPGPSIVILLLASLLLSRRLRGRG